ncbi:sensor histidine kinase [Rhodococcus sp. ANT_H53B]|uniref:sensor histidine kinase n=1 Tax=Rhodococcus sp. ANT_H53B TaxID=2597357 RepID=UPI0011F0693F|nr:ATP-binding protein [Rhodococcus sp. ANT_H53B]KAA0922937.1 ATP-binding protein [Rhodococcus sp. ANT_H53B]
MNNEQQVSTTDAAHHSTDRLIRIIGRFVGVGYGAYLLLLIPDIARTSNVVPGWWTPVTVAIVFGTGFAFAASTFHRSIGVIRIAGSVAALAFPIMAVLWWIAWDGETFDQAGTFLAAFPGLAALAAATVWHPVPAFAHMTTSVVIVQLTNQAVREPFPRSNVFADIVFAMMFCTVFVAATLAAVRTGRILDATISSAQNDAARAAAATAREVERERFDALIHDEVMSSLLAVARHGRTPSLARQARSALRHLDDLTTGTVSETFSADEALAQLRSAATTVDESIDFTVHEGALERTEQYPAETVRAIAAALAEALRNSLIHAQASERSVSARLAPSTLQVTVQDNGIGFDRRSVPPHRLGVAVSIEGRMRQLDGGSAEIESSTAGTTVRLSWKQ